MPLPSDLPGKPSEDLSHFSGREPERRLFWDYLGMEVGRLPRLPVLMFLGVGGNGKTWLLRHLKAEISGPFSDLPSVRIDFTKEETSSLFRDDPAALLSVVRKLAQEDACRRFDIAFAYLRVVRGITDETKIIHKGRSATWDVAREVLKFGLGATTHGKVLGLAWNVAEKLYPVLPKTDGTKRLAKLLLEDLEELRTQPPEVIEQSLVRRLADDIKEAASLHRNMFRAVQGVVFLDTMEALDDPALSPAALAAKTQALRDLIIRLNDRVLFVAAGQNRLRWDEFHPDWADSSWLEQHVLSGLEECVAKAYLDAYNISDPAIQSSILAVCLKDEKTYHPLHLGVLTDFAWVERDLNHRTLTADLFQSLPAGDWNTLVLRFLRSVESRVESNWIRKLALTPEFDERAARSAYSAEENQAQDTAWEVLQMFSFLSAGGFGQGWYTIHSAMRRAITIQSETRTATSKAMHEWWNSYWHRRADSAASYHLAWHHLYMVAAQQALPVWAAIANRALWGTPPNTILHAEMVSWWDTIDLMSKPTWTSSDLQGAFLLSAGLRRMAVGDRSNSLRRAIALNERCSTMLKPTDDSAGLWVENLIALAQAYAALPSGDMANQMQAAIGYLREALGVTAPSVFASTWAHAHDTLAQVLGNLPSHRKQDLQEALLHANEALLSSSKDDNRALWASSHSTLGLVYQKMAEGGDKLAARCSAEHYLAALEVLKPETFAQQWAGVQTGLCTLYHLKSKPDRDAADAQDSLQHGINALEVWKENLFPQQYASTQNAIANTLTCLPFGRRVENLTLALERFEAAARASPRDANVYLWAKIQSNRAVAYIELDNETNQPFWNLAIDCLNSSSEILKESAFPYDWALNESRFASAMLLQRGVDPKTGLTLAVEHYNSALKIWAREEFEEEWADVKKGLGEAYSSPKLDGSSMDLKKGVECLEAALTVKGKVKYPADFAEISLSLTNPLVRLAMNEVDRPEIEHFYIGKALGAFRESIAVVSIDFPFDRVVRAGQVLGKLLCTMFAAELIPKLDAHFQQLLPLLDRSRPEAMERMKVEDAVTGLLEIADVWINRLREEEGVG